MKHIGKALLLLFGGMTLCAGCGTQVGIAASPSEIYLEVGETAAVNIIAVMDLGATATVSEPLTMTSSNEEIAVVSDQQVTGVDEGTAVLAITDGVFTTTADVLVVAAGTLPTELVVTPTSVPCTPESDDTQLEVFAVLSTGSSLDVTDRVSYSSTNANIALVTAEGLVVCVGEGQAAITAEYIGVSDAIAVTVGAIPPGALDFSRTTLTCEAGEWHQVQVSATWDDGSTTDVSQSAAYSSSDTSVATASVGQVQCLSEGSATITADVTGVTGVLSVNVQAVPAEPDELVTLRISPSSVECGMAEAAAFAVLAEYGDGTTLNVTTNTQTQYQSSDTMVAMILQGQVLCAQSGQATISAAFGGLMASASVNVR